MQLSPLSSNITLNVNDGEINTVETPIKKNKFGFHSNLKTAETPDMHLSASKQTIADIEAEELFNNFSRIVTISESADQFESVELYRKLQYGQENNKLDFDQSTNSMQKKRKGSRLLPAQEGECIKVKPFLLDQGCPKINKDSNLKELSRQIYQEQNISPLIKKQNIKPGMMSTPTKKLIYNADLEKAAKKQQSFRDLQPRKNLFG